MSLLLTLCLSAFADTSLVPAGATWRYHDAGVEPVGDWTIATFDDSAWAAGPARLGYGDPEVVTTVGYGSDAANKHITTWFRHSFTLAALPAANTLRLSLLRDDGARVFLNGVEVVRSNLPAGTLTPATLAPSTVDGALEDAFEDFVVDPALLVVGTNVVAVEVHQRSGNSSDIGLDLALDALDGAPRLTRGPYLQSPTPTSMVVRWRTDQPTGTTLWLGGTPGGLTVASDDPTPTTEHSVQLANLHPGSGYLYAVGDASGVMAGDDQDHRFSTAPTPGASTPTRIWVLGDSGTADSSARAVRDAWTTYAAGTTPDVWLMLGDNAYPDGTDGQYQAAVFNMYPDLLKRVAIWPTLGNHDGHSADSATQSGPYYDLFTLPKAGQAGGEPSGTEAWYSFDHGDIHFICLDSYDSDRTPAGAMLQWLEDDLAQNTRTWTIAFWHHPPYSKGSHDSDTEAPLIEMRTHALPLLDAYGVDLVLTGHSHAYERSRLVAGHYGLSSTAAPSMLRDAGDGDPLGDGAYRKPTTGSGPDEGVVYAVAGSSGQTDGGALNHPVMVRSLSVLGSMDITIDGRTLTGRFIDDAGAVRDSFVVRKGLELAVGEAVAGQRARLTTSGAMPGETVEFVFTRKVAPGATQCPAPLGGACMDLRNPVEFLGSAVANAQGVAVFRPRVPATSPSGLTLRFMAAIRHPAAPASLSNAVLRTTGPLGCPRDVAPVCAVDGVTYTNACEADRAGTIVDHDGGC